MKRQARICRTCKLCSIYPKLFEMFEEGKELPDTYRAYVIEEEENPDVDSGIRDGVDLNGYACVYDADKDKRHMKVGFRTCVIDSKKTFEEKDVPEECKLPEYMLAIWNDETI